jgi:HEAT repeat protein
MRVRTLFSLGRIASRSVVDLASPRGRQAVDEIARVHALRADGDVVGLIHMLDSDVRGRSKNSIVRDHAAVALGRMGDPRAIPYLMDMRDDPEEMVRFGVIQALGRLKASEAEGFLLETMNDQNQSQLLRESAADALGRIGAVDAIPALWTILDSDPDRVMRFKAVQALVILGDESARDRVPEVLGAFTERELEYENFKRLREAVENGEVLTPWVAEWESDPRW